MNTRFLTWLLLVAMSLSLLPIASNAHANTVNPAPNVVPSVQQWTGASGYYQLSGQSDIVVNTQNEQELAETAATLKEDLKAITGKELAITGGAAAKAGDIFLTLDRADEAVGHEGYEMDIADAVTIKAQTAAGIFYGTRTLLQILEQDLKGKDNAPKGAILDYPKIRERGIMLDAGRRYYSMAAIEDTIKRMAWHKMNSLHMHFTEWNGFRLQSDNNPGLAPAESYSKADIREMQDIAKKYHVMIIPEIDLPGHATAINRYKPELNFACASMKQRAWYSTDWTLDITKDVTRQWIKDLLDEFIPLFDAPYFHIGTDEYQYDSTKNACPELVAYAQQRGFPYTGDVFVNWMNEVNDQVKSYGKTLQMWVWWNFGGQKYSISPDKDIVMNVWKDLDPSWYFDQGYDVVGIPEPILYVTPGLNITVNLKNVYESWNPVIHPKMRGYRMAVWADNMEYESDDFYEEKSGKARQVLAERLWGGPRSATIDKYLERVRLAGDAPGVNNPLPTEPLGILSVENDSRGTGLNQVEYAGSGWGHGSDSYNHTTNAYYQIKFNGTQIKLWGAKDPKHGIAGISIDGGPETEADLYAASRSDQYLYTSPVLPSGEHTIKVRVTGKKNNAATDRFVVLDRADIVSRMTVDNSVQGTGLHQFNYVGNWMVESDSYSKTTNDYFQMTFNGRQVILAGAKAPAHGIAAISMDGGPEQRVDLYAASRTNDVSYYVSPLLGPGEHTVKVRVTGEKHASATEPHVVIDRIEIVPHEIKSVTGVSLNKAVISLQPGQTEQLSAIVTPLDATNRNVTWSSSDSSVARVDSNGLVTAVAKGSAAVIVRTEDGTHEAAAQVTVADAEPEQVSMTLAGPANVKAGELFVVELGLEHIGKRVQAQDIVISYEAGLFEFVETDSRLEQVKVIQLNNDASGRLRLIVASVGRENALQTDGAVLSLKWRAKQIEQPASGYFKTTKAIVSDAEGNEEDAQLASIQLNISPIVPVIPGDVNNDGKVSIGDLSIIAAHYGKDADSVDWQLVRYADVNGDGKIDIADLVMIAKKLIE